MKKDKPSNCKSSAFGGRKSDTINLVPVVVSSTSDASKALTNDQTIYIAYKHYNQLRKSVIIHVNATVRRFLK